MGVVGYGDHLLFVLEAEDRRDRAESLLARDQHRGVDARDHRRLVEGAAERMALAADDDLRALRYSVRDVLLDLRRPPPR